jgi:hypothetical protein
MGFLDFLKGIGKGVLSGIQKVAGFVGKIAPAVGHVAGLIPTPLTQGIAAAANLVGGAANAANTGAEAAAAAANGTPPPAQGGVAQAPVLGGAPAPQAPIM